MSEIAKTRRSTRISMKSTKSLENLENMSHVINSKTPSRKRLTQTETVTKKTDYSPPKQPKLFDNSSTSPSTSMKNLNLNESSTLNENTIKKSSSQSKYSDARKVLNKNQAMNLPGRENELIKLTEFLDNCLVNKQSGSLYISGTPGTGKTSCVLKLLNESYCDKFTAIYINCTGMATIGSIYKKICEELKLKKGTEKENLANILDFITKSNKRKMILLLLDEIDELAGNKQSVLYTIFEWPLLEKSKLVLIGIANAMNLIDRLLTRLHTKPQLLHFTSYTKPQIIAIFKSRLEEAGVMDIFPPATIELLAAKVSAVSGDIRRALDIGGRVIQLVANKVENKQIELNDLGVEYLNGKQTEENVKLQDVLNVVNNVYSNATKMFDDDANSGFPFQQKIILCTILLMLKNGNNKDITIGRTYPIYSKICKKENIVPVDQCEFVSLCEAISDRGITKLIKAKESKFRKIQLIWDENEIMTALHDKQLIANILSDTSCLGK